MFPSSLYAVGLSDSLLLHEKSPERQFVFLLIQRCPLDVQRIAARRRVVGCPISVFRNKRLMIGEGPARRPGGPSKLSSVGFSDPTLVRFLSADRALILLLILPCPLNGQKIATAKDLAQKRSSDILAAVAERNGNLAGAYQAGFCRILHSLSLQLFERKVDCLLEIYCCNLCFHLNFSGLVLWCRAALMLRLSVAEATERPWRGNDQASVLWADLAIKPLLRLSRACGICCPGGENHRLCCFLGDILDV